MECVNTLNLPLSPQIYTPRQYPVPYSFLYIKNIFLTIISFSYSFIPNHWFCSHGCHAVVFVILTQINCYFNYIKDWSVCYMHTWIVIIMIGNHLCDSLIVFNVFSHLISRETCQQISRWSVSNGSLYGDV